MTGVTFNYDVGPFKVLKEGHVHNPAPFAEAVQAVCGTPGCENQEAVADPSGHYTTFHKCKDRFEREGWKIGKVRADFRCPVCVANARKPKVMPKPLKEVAAMPAAQPEPPRQPTREQRRTIIDALEAHYDVKNERYTETWSDKTLAEKLKVPQAWVAEERDRAYGPDVNEAGARREAAIVALEAKVAEVEEAGRKALEEIRAELAALKTAAA